MTVDQQLTKIDLRGSPRSLPQVVTLRQQARVSQVIGLAIEAEGLSVETGEICEYPCEPRASSGGSRGRGLQAGQGLIDAAG